MASEPVSSTPSEPSPPPTLPFNPAAARPSTQAERTRRQAALFFGGAAFTILSGLITRRALIRRNRPLASSLTTPTAAAAEGGTQSGPTILSKGAPKSGEAQGYNPVVNETRSFARKTAAEAEAAAGKNAAGDAASSTEAGASQLETSGAVLAAEALTLATLNVFSFAVMATGGLMWAFDIGNVEDLRRKIRGGLGFDGTGRTEEEAQEEVEEWIVDVLARKERKELIREQVAKERDAKTGPDGGWKNERGKGR